MVTALEDTRENYKERVAAGMRLNNELKELSDAAAVKCDIKYLSYTITIPTEYGKIDIYWNVPHQMEMIFMDCTFGSDYIKTDKEWNKLAELITLIVGKLLGGKFVAFEYQKQGKRVGGMLKIKGMKIKLQDNSTPLIKIGLRKVRR